MKNILVMHIYQCYCDKLSNSGHSSAKYNLTSRATYIYKTYDSKHEFVLIYWAYLLPSRGICRVNFGIFFTLKIFTFNGKNFGAFKVSLEFLCTIYEKRTKNYENLYLQKQGMHFLQENFYVSTLDMYILNTLSSTTYTPQ